MSVHDRRKQALLREGIRILSEMAAEPYRASPPATMAKITNADDVVAAVSDMPALDHEELRVLLLDNRTQLIDVVPLYRGNVSTVVVRITEVLRPAVIANAPSIIVVHNHPAGDPAPSAEDIALTKQLSEGAELLGIELLDHVIVSWRGHKSLLALGQLGRKVVS